MRGAAAAVGRALPSRCRPPPAATVLAVASSRIELEPEEVAGLIRGSRLLELRADTAPDVRRRWTDTALTAMDALCGLAERRGTDAVWDALGLVTHRELLAFATLMAAELAETDFALAPPEEADAGPDTS
jgi:hypothetical protein